MRRPSGIDAPSPTRWPRKVLAMAGLFALICFALQAWRLFSLSATYDQALFLQELWATAQGRPFESSLSSVLSGAVVVGDGLPSIDYLHLGQHANVLTVLMAPLVAVFGMWALPLLQVGLLGGAGLVLWRLADARVPRPLAERITLAYFLSGAVIGPALENFHDLVWLPLLAFLVVGGLLDGCRWRVCLFGALLLLVREDSGLLLFSLGLWALVRRPDQRITGALLMLVSFAWVVLVTGWIQPMVDSSLSDRFLKEKFGHLVDDPSGGTVAVLWAMLRQPLALLEALVSPPGATLGFVLALSLPLMLVPLLSVDAALLMLAPLLIALLSQGRSALSVTLRYVLALVPGLYLGAVLWWQRHPEAWSKPWLRRCWTAALSLGLVLTLVGNPHRTLSAVIPDSFSPWAYVSPQQMLNRRQAASQAVALIPADASVAADTPLLPLLAQREAAIRFPRHVEYRDRDGRIQPVDWVVALPGYHTPLAQVFKGSRNKQQRIQRELRKLTASGDYRLLHCQGGAVVLQRQAPDTVPDPSASSGSSNSCHWLE